MFKTSCQSFPIPWMRAIVRFALEPLLRTQKTNCGTTWKNSNSSVIWSTCFLISGASQYFIGIFSSFRLLRIFWTCKLKRLNLIQLALRLKQFFQLHPERSCKGYSNNQHPIPEAKTCSSQRLLHERQNFPNY